MSDYVNNIINIKNVSNNCKKIVIDYSHKDRLSIHLYEWSY